MTETYLGVQEQKYARDVYAVLGWVLSDCCATIIDTTKTILYAHCVNQHLKKKIHFLITCPSNANIRSQFIPANDSSASVEDYYVQQESDVIRPVAKYIHPAFKLKTQSE